MKARRAEPRGDLAMVSPTVLSLDGRPLAVGLLWQIAAEGMTVGAAALAAGGRFDLRVRRGRGQIGFAATEDGYRTGLTVGATIFDDARLGSNWLIAWMTGDGSATWLVAGRDGHVFEDRLVQDREEARDRFRDLAAGPDWDRIIAPRELGLGEGVDEEMCAPLAIGRAKRLRPIGWSRRIAMPGLAVIALAGVLGLVWQGHALIGERVVVSEAPPKTETITHRPPPWARVPSAEAFMIGCTQGMDRVGREIIGWQLGTVVCRLVNDGARIEARWQRAGGTPARLRDGVEAGEVRFVDDNASAVAVHHVALPIARWRDPDAPGAITGRLFDRFQAAGLTMQVERKAGRLGDDGTVIEYPHHDLAVAASAGIGEAAELLGEVGGLVPRSLAYDPGRNVWLLSVRAYHLAQEEAAQ